MRVVFADDSSILRPMLRNLCNQLGHEVVGEAADGRAAVELCALHKPDVAILDVLMLEMSGDMAAREIRAAGTAKYIVFLTSQNNDQMLKVAKECNAFLRRKPFHYAAEIDTAIKGAVALVDSP